MPGILLITSVLRIFRMSQNERHRTDLEMQAIELVNVNYELEVLNHVNVNPISLPENRTSTGVAKISDEEA